MQPNDLTSMVWSGFGQALPYLVFLAAFVIALKWLEAKFAPKKRLAGRFALGQVAWRSV